MYLILLFVAQPNQIPGRTTLALPLWKSNRGLRFRQVYEPHRCWDSSPLFCYCSVRPGLLFRVTLRDETSFCSLLCFVSCRFCKQLRAAFKDSVSTLFGTVLVSRADIPFVQLLMHSLNQIWVMFAQSLQRNVGESGQHVLPLLIAAVDGLARDDIIRRSLARDPDCWQAFLHAIVSSLPLLLPSPANTLSTWSAVRRLHLMVNVCLLSLQERCIACKYTDVLCPLLGLIVNTSTISSPVIGVRVVICHINDNCNYPKGTLQKMNNQTVYSSRIPLCPCARCCLRRNCSQSTYRDLRLGNVTWVSVFVPPDFTPFTSCKGKKKKKITKAWVGLCSFFSQHAMFLIRAPVE